MEIQMGGGGEGGGGSLNFENLGEGVLKPLLKFRWKRESKNHAFCRGGGVDFFWNNPLKF